MDREFGVGALDSANAATVYVGFLDVLGFGGRVLGDFDEALALYNRLFEIREVQALAPSHPELRINLLSDAFVVTSPHFVDVVVAANTLQFAALAGPACLLRGGIGYGAHVEKAVDGNHFVVSEPLTRAVLVEKRIKHPCVALDGMILPDPALWFEQPSNVLRIVLYYEGHWLVNPCGVMWGESAAHRVREMRETVPAHAAKFDWFLELHRRIFEPAPLIPSRDEWITMGGIVDDAGRPRLRPTALLGGADRILASDAIEEFEPTPEQLSEYHAVYRNEDVRHLRAVFDDATSGRLTSETELVRSAEAYLSGKFTVMSRDATSAGVYITLMFQGKADALFRAWVRVRGENAGELELGGFERINIPNDEIQRIAARYRRFLSDPEYAM